MTPLATPSLPRPRPERTRLVGRYVRLEPLDAALHAEDLFESCAADAQARARHRYLFADAPENVEAMREWAEQAARTADPLLFAVVDQRSGRALGRQALMRIEPAHGVIEIGHILWGAGLARTRLATEAFYLMTQHAIDVLGYRRYEWKCNVRNEASKRAALRFGFTPEGVFRQHMWVKGENRDTAWFSVLDREWHGGLRAAFERWLDPANFDEHGAQRESLATCIADARVVAADSDRSAR